MTRLLRLLALSALLVAPRAFAGTALFSTLQPDGNYTITTLPLLADGSAGGPAVDLVRDTAWLGAAHPRFSPDGTLVLFRGDDPTQAQYDRLYVVPATGGPLVDITPTAVAGLLSGASWTPDGARVLVVGVLPTASGPWSHEIFSVPLAGGEAQQLTFDGDGGSKYFPVASPDGRWIAYVWQRPQGPGTSYALAVVPATGGRARVLDTDTIKANPVSWAPDSRSIAYARWNGQGTYTDVYRVELRNGQRKNLTGGRFQGEPAGSWQGSVSSVLHSPDGTRIAFAYVAGPRPSPRGDLWVLDAIGAATRVNGDAPVAMYSIEAGFAWSPDGARLVFPYIHSDAADPNAMWSWNEGLISTGVGAPLYGPLFPGQVADVTVR